MDQSTRDRICSRSRTDGQVAVEINWTGPVTLICLVSQSCQFGQARSDQISADCCLLGLLAITVTAHYRPLLPRSRQPDTGKRPWYMTFPCALDGSKVCLWKGGGRGHSQGPQSSEAGTINRWQVTSTRPRRSIRTQTGGAVLVADGGGANMALCLQIKLSGASGCCFGPRQN